jgi:hypothetical protein
MPCFTAERIISPQANMPKEEADVESATIAGEPPLLERLLPQFDARRVERRVVPGDIETVYAATLRADFLRAWRENVAVRFIFGARELGERLVSAVRRRPFEPPPPPNSLRLADMGTHGEWVRLGEAPPFEIVFGTIGRFWAGETVWEEIDAGEFAAFDRPGFGKIAAGFRLQRSGEGQTLVAYECRTKGTDPAARKGFLRYWRPLSPFIGVVLRAHLRVIEDEARAAGARLGSPTRF